MIEEFDYNNLTELINGGNFVAEDDTLCDGDLPAIFTSDQIELLGDWIVLTCMTTNLPW